MNRSFVYQAAIRAALLGACASLFPVHALASGRMAPVVSSPEAATKGVGTPSPAPAPYDDAQWTYLGPGRAPMAQLVVSPTQPDRMMALVEQVPAMPLLSPYFQTDSAGEAWTFDSANLGRADDVAFDAAGRRLVAGLYGLNYREPGGANWNLVMNPEWGLNVRGERVAVGPGANDTVWLSGLAGTRRVFRANPGLTSLSIAPVGVFASAQPVELAVSALQPERVAAGSVEVSGTVRVFVTADDGDTWSDGVSLPAALARLTALRWVDQRLFAGGVLQGSGEAVLWSRVADGASWQLEQFSEVPVEGPVDVAGRSGQPDTLWVGTSAGVFRSSDGGQSWLPPAPGSVQQVRRLLHEPVHDRLWAALSQGGVWASDDDGMAWYPRDHRLGAAPVVDVAANPKRPGEVATAMTGLFPLKGEVATSLDGGLTWAANVAPMARNAGAVRFGPQSGLLYATLRDGRDTGVYRREAGGQWQHIGLPWPAFASVDMGDINFGASEDTILVAGRALETAYTGRLWRSGDAGQSWQQVLQTQDYSQLQRIERTMGPNGRRVFVLEDYEYSAGPGHLWASDDDGLSWFDVLAPLPPGRQLQYCAGSEGQLLLVHTDMADGGIRAFRSSNAGDSWAPTAWAPGTAFEGVPFASMHCPGDAQQVFFGGSFGSLWLSTDGGDSLSTRLADGATWGETPVESITLTPMGLYVGHRGGTWVNTDFVGGGTAPTDLVVHRTLSRMRYRTTLSWSGGGNQVQVRRDGQVVAIVANTGQWSTTELSTGSTPEWQVCDVDGNCSAVVSPSLTGSR